MARSADCTGDARRRRCRWQNRTLGTAIFHIPNPKLPNPRPCGSILASSSHEPKLRTLVPEIWIPANRRDGPRRLPARMLLMPVLAVPLRSGRRRTTATHRRQRQSVPTELTSNLRRRRRRVVVCCAQILLRLPMLIPFHHAPSELVTRGCGFCEFFPEATTAPKLRTRSGRHQVGGRGHRRRLFARLVFFAASPAL